MGQDKERNRDVLWGRDSFKKDGSRLSGNNVTHKTAWPLRIVKFLEGAPELRFVRVISHLEADSEIYNFQVTSR